MNSPMHFPIFKRLLIFYCFSGFVLWSTTTAKAQENPPRPISIHISLAQGLMFGAFMHGPAGGTVTISPLGLRSATSSVVLLSLGLPFSPAIFQIEGNKGTLITIANIPGSILNGSNGGHLHLNFDPPQTASSSGSPFILNTTTPLRMNVMIGGTLSVSDALSNPPGYYSGTFDVTFIQQ
jgi:hypothetical protein